MERQLYEYIKYGIYNETLYFPCNQRSIKDYINRLKPLAAIIKDSNVDEVLDLIANEKSNIIITSCVLSNIDINDRAYSILKNKIKAGRDLYIFLSFVINNEKYDKSIIQDLYDEKFYLLGEYKELCFKLVKPQIKIKSLYLKYKKEVKEIRHLMDRGRVIQDTIQDIINSKIHPEDLGYYMSYHFNQNFKTEMVIYFIQEYGVLEILPFLEKWFIESIPESVIKLVEEKIYEINDVNEVSELLIFYKKTKNIRLKGLIESIFTEYQPIKSNKELTIYVVPTLKQKYKIDRDEIYDYLFLNGVNSSLVDAEFDTTLFINNSLIQGDLMRKINRIDGNELTLKPEIQHTEGKLDVLFSNLILPGFNFIWDVTSEHDVEFINRGYIFIAGRSVYLLPNLIKYIKDIE